MGDFCTQGVLKKSIKIKNMKSCSKQEFDCIILYVVSSWDSLTENMCGP